MTNLKFNNDINERTFNFQDVLDLFKLPFIDLIFKAQNIHRKNFNPNVIQASSLLSIKTGNCPEDCSYCPQSGHHKSNIKKESLLDVEKVLELAKKAKEDGATRYCLGAAWKSPPGKDFPKVIEMIQGIKALGLEACVTLGMLDDNQAKMLKDAGLDYYNHNLDTSRNYYSNIITTRTYQDRLDTITNVINNDINVCCGGILGMGETREDRINFLLELYNLPKQPQSIPINNLIPSKGTPLEDLKPLDSFEFIRTIAVARIMFPKSYVRLSAGRENMSFEMQALCFLAGANSLFMGDKLLTANNQEMSRDAELFRMLNLSIEA